MIIVNIIILLLSTCLIIENKPIINKEKVSNNLIIQKTFENTFYKKGLYKDDSITKYLDNKISFNDKLYVPKNLVYLKGKYILNSKENQKIRKIALQNLQNLSKNYYYTFNRKLKIVSSYRSYSYQKGIKDRGCSDIFCAKAGYSEHQSGLALDFWEASKKERFEKNEKLKTYFNWMKDNGAKHGFTNTYQKGLEIDGYAVEPWHWRYVGVKLATYLKKENITFAEFYYKNNLK